MVVWSSVDTHYSGKTLKYSKEIMWLGASQNTAFHVLNATFAFPALARRANIRITQSGLEQKVIGQRKSLDLE